MKEERKHTLETGFFELALDAGFLAVDAGLADAFEAGFADPAREALDAGFSAAFEAGLDAGAALLAGLEAALEADLAYKKNKVHQHDEKIKRVKKLKEKKGGTRHGKKDASTNTDCRHPENTRHRGARNTNVPS